MKEQLFQQHVEPGTFIQLKGEPYQQYVNNGHGQEFIDCSLTFSHLVDSTNYRTYIKTVIAKNEPLLEPLLKEDGYYTLDGKIKHGQNLTFSEAFSLGTFVCAALNKPLHTELANRIQNLGPHETHLLQATSLLSALSAKEAYVGLTSEEIAGIVAATVSLDTVVHVNTKDALIGFGGMGGDRGYPMNGEKTKLFSLSTLAAIATAVETPVMKHHSYPNTSKVAGQSAIEAYGARSDFHSLTAFNQVLQETNLIMTSCHDTRSLHTLSHRLKGETINHVIGPLGFTTSPDTIIHGMIGVNEKIHPELIIQALGYLHEYGFQTYGNSVAYFGTDLRSEVRELLDPVVYQHDNDIKKHIAIDEVAPPPYITIAAFRKDGQNIGSFTLYPEDFYPSEILREINPDDLRIHNTRDGILNANNDAITGTDTSKTRYLAMTIGLALFTKDCLKFADSIDVNTRRVNPLYLRACTQKAYELLQKGEAKDKLLQYVESTQRYAGGRI